MRDAFAALRPEDAEALADAGVPAFLIDLYQMVGTAQILLRKGALYEPHSDGKAAFITPVLADLPDTPETSDPWAFARFGNIIDLVAWDYQAPEHWALRTGNATVLGCIAPQYIDPFPVKVWRNPLNWLRSNANGLAMLSRKPSDIYRALAGLQGGIEAEDDMHAVQLRRILARPFPVPSIRAAVPRSAA